MLFSFSKILPCVVGHNLQPASVNSMSLCEACVQGKLIAKPSLYKLPHELPPMLSRLHGDICGPITPMSGPFRYFLVLVDASGRQSHVSLLSSRNLAFANLLSMLIRFKAHFPDYPIQTLRMDNAQEFRSKAFEDYCKATGIDLTYSVPYEHAQNGLAESFIKRIQWITRPLLLHANLPSTMWGHAVLHAATLIRLRPSSMEIASSQELLSGRVPDISHLRVFGCRVWVPVSEPYRHKTNAHRQEGIYVGFDSPSIIRYITPTTGTLLRARFANCRFEEDKFPALTSVTSSQGAKPLIFKASETFILNPDPRSSLAESEVAKILYLQKIANQTPDGFNNASRITMNPLNEAQNLPARVSLIDSPSVVPALPTGKRTRGPDKQPRKRRVISDTHPSTLPLASSVTNPTVFLQTSPIDEISPSNMELSISYCNTGEILNRPDIDFDDNFICMIAETICCEKDDPEPTTVDEAMRRSDWPNWKVAIKEEYKSLRKRQVFGPIVNNLTSRPLGYKLVFVRKRDDKGTIIRYKVRLVAQGFTQQFGIHYDSTYSPVMDSITFRYLIGMAVHFTLEMRLMDVVTAYLYGSLETNLYMKVPPGLEHTSLPAPIAGKHRGVKLQRALYGLKQSGRIWYQRLRDFLISHHFINDQLLPCLFIKRDKQEFVIIAVYVDDLNLVGTSSACTAATQLLTQEFEMKLLGQTTFCIGLQVLHLKDGSVFLSQSTYINRILKRFNMIDAHPLSTPMVGRSNKGDDPYRPCEEEEEILGEQYPYLAAVGALLYLATSTRPDISFAVSVLARHSARPTLRHWNGIKHLFRYLKGTEHLGLHYTRSANPTLVGYADAGYRSDPATSKSQTGYVFLRHGAAISWKSVKQTVTATSSNHSEVIALHEASRECIWLRSVDKFILTSSGLPYDNAPTILYEDNSACVSQMQAGFIKGDRTKHIDPKYFSFTHDLITTGVLEIKKIISADNLADLFTKALPVSVHRRLVYGIGMRQLNVIEQEVN